HFPASGHVVSWGLPEVLKLDTYIWREGRFGVPIGETYRGFGNRQLGSELAAGSFASDIDRFCRRVSGAPTGNGRPGGNDYGSYQPNDTESACNRLPVSDLGLALCRFRNAPLLAQIGMVLVAGLLTYVPIMLGATILILPERGRRISVAWGLLGFGLICGAVTYGVILFGLYSAAYG